MDGSPTPAVLLNRTPIFVNPALPSDRPRDFVSAYCAMDLLLVVDSSGSVRDNQLPNTPDNWQLTKDFVKEVIRRGTRVGRFHDRIALIEFSSMAMLSFDFNQYSAQSDVLAAVDRLPYIGSTTNISLAIDLGRRVFVNPLYGSRPNATHIMLLITDLFETPDLTWQSLFNGNVSLLSQTTDVQRFSKYTSLVKVFNQT